MTSAHTLECAEPVSFNAAIRVLRCESSRTVRHAPLPAFDERIDIRRVGVGVDFGIDVGHIHLIGYRHRLTEQFRTTDHPDFRTVETVIRNGLLTCQIKRVLKTADNRGANRDRDSQVRRPMITGCDTVSS